MKTLYQLMALAALVTLLPSCRKGNVSRDSGSSICLSSREADPAGTRSGAGGVDRNLQPLFLFWTDGHFNDATVEAPDFFVRTPDGEINDYTSTKYNTLVHYPVNDATEYATGFAPSPGDGYLTFATEGDYSVFNIPEQGDGIHDDTRGVMDILSAGTVSGNNSTPIPDPLLFKHAQTKLVFDARSSATNTKYVKYVEVEFPGSLTPTTLEWNATSGTYEVKGGTDGFLFGKYYTEGDSRANYTRFRILRSEEDTPMGYTMIVPPGSEMTVTVRYKICDTPGGLDVVDPLHPAQDVVMQNIRVPFTDAGGSPISLRAGDSYSITLIIDAKDIALIGRQRNWKDGGYVSIPIYPNR